MNIHYITPYRGARPFDLGGELNARIGELPYKCWICMRDGDTMFLSPDFGDKIEAVIGANPEYDLITCKTNRLGLPALLVPGMFEEDSISAHLFKARELWEQYGTSVSPAMTAPGMFMLFRRELWEKNHFLEQTTIFDIKFSEYVAMCGGKIGVANGIYLLHLYRYLHPDPRTYNNHLL